MSHEIACRITAFPPGSAERNRFLYFIVRGGKTVSEMKSESVRGSKQEGREGCPETGLALLDLVGEESIPQGLKPTLILLALCRG